jgi:hypothetical protein
LGAPNESASAALETADRIARNEILADYPKEITTEITAEMIEAGCRVLSPHIPDWLTCERVAETYCAMRIFLSSAIAIER